MQPVCHPKVLWFRVIMCTVLTTIRIQSTITWHVWISCKVNNINAYSPSSNPEFSLCKVSTDTTTSVYNSFFSNYEITHFSACEPKVHQPLARTQAIGGGAWVVDMKSTRSRGHNLKNTRDKNWLVDNIKSK